MIWVALLACFVENRQELDVPIVAGGTGVTSYTAADGGTVELASARVNFADLRLEEPPEESAMLRVIRATSWVTSAQAHPGHDYPGDVAGELLGSFSVDLLAEDQELGVAPCYEGEFATGRVLLAGTAATFTGTHTIGDVVRDVSLVVPADQEIIGIPFETTLSVESPPNAVAVRFDIASALQFVDWSAPDTDGDGVLTVADGTTGNTALFGVVATPSWSLSIAN